MDKAKRKKLAEGNDEKNKEVLIKALAEGIPVKITIKGKKKEVFWNKAGHADRAYLKAYLSKKCKLAVEMGAMDILHVKESIESKSLENIFVLDHIAPLDKTLIIEADGTIVPGNKYSYNVDLGVLVFTDKVTGKFTIEYDYYEDEGYSEINDTFATVMMIYLSVKDADDHNKPVFKNLAAVEKLQLTERNIILGEYIDKIEVTEQELKNLQSPTSSEIEEISPKEIK